MLKVFLVEDEAIIRKSIVKSVNWEQEGFELAGSAGDGEIAWPLIRETRPDIVVTDIKMPFMDGLELSKLIRRELPHTKILILSGFDDFDYAKQAIEIGVSEYLLKPITADKLLESLHKAEKQILEEKKSRDMIVNYARRFEQEDAQREEEQIPVDVEELDPKALNRTAFMDFLVSGSREDVPSFTEIYIDRLGRKNLRSVLFLQYVVSDLYLTCNAFLDRLGADRDEKNDMLGSLEDAVRRTSGGGKDFVDFVNVLVTSMIDYRDQNRKSRPSSQIMKATIYIREHYSEEDISLNLTAEEVGMSPTHFSTTFKQETGQGFSEYLTEVRMNAAKNLLASTDLRMSEIAEQIGYNDPHYFSAAFKKTQGLTPKDYRKNSRRSET